MKISINWLKDFVDLKGISNKELINRLTLSTAEIEEVFEYGKDLKDIYVGEILKVEAHPNSKKLTVLEVNVGKEILQIVCGAPNCKKDMKVAVVIPGGEVGGHKIGVANLGGAQSHGMCLSERELGMGEDHDGIIELPKDFQVGKKLKDLLPIEDTVFEVDNKSLTNRPDLWCHYGFAREVSAIFNKKLKPLQLADLNEYNHFVKIPMEIKDADKCYRYSVLKIDNVTEKVSPVEMKIRLFYTGMRGINLLADLSNYIMLEVGQPTHAFDSSKIEEIVIDTPKEETTFVTLDSETRKIDKNTLMIYNKNTPVAIAGIMGGLNSEIETETTSVILESATFDATSTRRSANRLNLRTEASMRYEKSLDPFLTTLAIKRYVYLLRQIDSEVRVTSSLTDDYEYIYDTITIKTNKSYFEKYIGLKFSVAEIEGILTRLGFAVKTEGENFKVTVPSFRATKDVRIAADLVEEIARIYGYDNILPEPVEAKIEPVEQDREHKLEYQVKSALAEKFALSEVHSYLWNDVKANKELNIETKGYVKVLNSTVKDNDEIRSELMPTLIKMVNENKNREEEMGIFEIARVVTGLNKDKNVIEKKHLSIVLASRNKTEEELYFKLKEILEFMFKTYNNKKVVFKPEDTTSSYLHPVNSIAIDGMGQVGILHPAVTGAIDKKMSIAGLELDFQEFSKKEAEVIKLKQPNKYQTTTLDFNFLADKDKCYFDIEILFANLESELNFTFKLKDVFEDEKLGDKKSYTFGFEIGADHTLTSIEIGKFYDGLINYAKDFGLELRK
jgi:phenylalanyl-tRNA synthetase beta chain